MYVSVVFVCLVFEEKNSIFDTHKYRIKSILIQINLALNI